MVTWIFDLVFYENKFIRISYYGCLFLISFIFSIFIFHDVFKVLYKTQLYLVFISILGIFFGKLFFYLFFAPENSHFSLRSGLSSHGILVGLFLSSFMISIIYNEQLNRLLNVCLTSSTISGSLIRIGNFLNIEKFGDLFESSFSLQLNFIKVTINLNRHPIQIYEFIVFFVVGLLFILFKIYKRNDPVYLYICLFIFGYRSLIGYFFCHTCNLNERLFNYLYFFIFFVLSIRYIIYFKSLN